MGLALLTPEVELCAEGQAPALWNASPWFRAGHGFPNEGSGPSLTHTWQAAQCLGGAFARKPFHSQECEELVLKITFIVFSKYKSSTSYLIECPPHS